MANTKRPAQEITTGACAGSGSRLISFSNALNFVSFPSLRRLGGGALRAVLVSEVQSRMVMTLFNRTTLAAFPLAEKISSYDPCYAMHFRLRAG